MVKLTEVFVLSKAKASHLHNVRKLNLWACDLTDVSVLRKLPNLTVATLSSNHISTLADVSHCTNLEELYIRCNGVSTVAELTHLKALSKLRVLWLEGNPCTKDPEYRLIVLRLLPRLHRLDNIVVEDEELCAATELRLSRLMCADLRLDSQQQTLDAESLPPGDIPSSEVVNAGHEQSAAAVERVDSVSHVVSTTDSLTGRQQSTDVPNNKRFAAVELAAVTSTRPQSSVANILQAVLCLLSELEHDNLEIVADAVRNRLSSL